MNSHYTLAIIGSGPAGLAAAEVAARHGVDVALFDEQAEPGGQIYRAMESIPEHRAHLLGDEYRRGERLVKAFRSSSAHYFPDTQVWSLNRNREIGILRRGQAGVVSADQVLISTGAMERPVPFPGWTLPGVMNAGAGQILLKAHGIVPNDGVVLAGSGPLLLLLAWQYMQAGVTIRALLDVTPMMNHLYAMPRFPRALLAGHYLVKGMGYKRDLKRAGHRNSLRDGHADPPGYDDIPAQMLDESQQLFIVRGFALASQPAAPDRHANQTQEHDYDAAEPETNRPCPPINPGGHCRIGAGFVCLCSSGIARDVAFDMSGRSCRLLGQDVAGD